MAFLKTSIAINTQTLTTKEVRDKIEKTEENQRIQGNIVRHMTEEQIKNLLRDYKNGEDIGFVPTEDFLKRYGF